jgi:hypothetical protein
MTETTQTKNKCLKTAYKAYFFSMFAILTIFLSIIFFHVYIKDANAYVNATRVSGTEGDSMMTANVDPELGPENATVQFWIKTDVNTDAGGTRFIMINGDGAMAASNFGDSGQFMIWLDGLDTFRARWNTDSSFESIDLSDTQTATYFDGSWVHVALTHTLTDGVKMYINGEEITPDSVFNGSGGWDDDQGCHLQVFGQNLVSPDCVSGIRADTFLPITASMSDLRIYDTARSETQIASNYLSFLSDSEISSEPNLIANWQLWDDLLDKKGGFHFNNLGVTFGEEDTPQPDPDFTEFDNPLSFINSVDYALASATGTTQYVDFDIEVWNADGADKLYYRIYGVVDPIVHVLSATSSINASGFSTIELRDVPIPNNLGTDLFQIYMNMVSGSSPYVSHSSTFTADFDIATGDIFEQHPCGLTNIAGCIINALQFLFVPRDANIDDWQTSKDNLLGKFPFAYPNDLNTIYTSMQGTETATQTFSLSVDIPFQQGTSTLNFIDSSTVTTMLGGATLTSLRFLFGMVVYMGFVFYAFTRIKSLLAKI